MSFPDFVPIEYRGMSILTALFFVFIGAGATLLIQIMKRELKRVDDRIDLMITDCRTRKSHLDVITKEQNERYDSQLESISEMKINIALLVQSTIRIEKHLEKLQ